MYFGDTTDDADRFVHGLGFTSYMLQGLVGRTCAHLPIRCFDDRWNPPPCTRPRSGASPPADMTARAADRDRASVTECRLERSTRHEIRSTPTAEKAKVRGGGPVVSVPSTERSLAFSRHSGGSASGDTEQNRTECGSGNRGEEDAGLGVGLEDWATRTPAR